METRIRLAGRVKLSTRLRSVYANLRFGARALRVNRAMAETGRRLTAAAHRVSVFVELDDPYSYLLCSYLPELRSHYDIELRFYLTTAMAGDFRPAANLYHEYALRDCGRLANELGIPFLDKGSSPPVEYRRALLDVLAAQASKETFGEQLITSISAYWRGDAEGVGRQTARSGEFGSANELLEKNQRRLRKLGHYNSAMLHYGGEWYWGVDRLHYLVERLDGLGAAREAGLAPRIASIQQVMRPNLPVTAPGAANAMPPVELFYSFRSPYSWLLLQRLYRIADAFSVPVVVRPVLPMVMRGLQVPAAKLRYIGFDASREARQHGVAFGKMADPVGAGVERCMAVWNYARQEKRERDFLESVGKAIWARGIDVATDAGLRAVGAKAGLFWPEVLAALNDESWRKIAEDNQAALTDSGCWGVPSVRIGDWITWGQDRDWLVARHLEELCDNGDGILV